MTTSTMSAQSTTQLKNGQTIQITAETFPADARAACANRLAGDGLPPEQARALVDANIAGIARIMSAANTQLELAENAYAQEQADDPPARKQRDDAAAELSLRRSDVRTHVVRRFGPLAVREYGLEGEPPTNPDALAKQTANTIKLLRANPKSHTSPLGNFTTAAAADYLKEAQATLAAALTTVTTETKELQDSLGLRDAAVTNWTNVYQSAATLLEGFLRLGGRPDLAERVRPTARRSTGLELNPSSPTDPTPAPAPADPTPVTPAE